MSDRISYQGNAETRGTLPVKFFEAASGPPPADARATPRPADRPREVPPDCATLDTFQLFECERHTDVEGAKATPRPAGQERTAQDPSSAPPGLGRG
jgi:hypothetical protein